MYLFDRSFTGWRSCRSFRIDTNDLEQLCLCYFAGAGLSKSFLNLISRCAELLYRSTHPSGEFGQLLRAEEKEHDKEDCHHVRAHQIQDTGDRWSHKHVSLNGRLLFIHSTDLADLYSRKVIFDRVSLASFSNGSGIKRGKVSPVRQMRTFMTEVGLWDAAPAGGVPNDRAIGPRCGSRSYRCALHIGAMLRRPRTVRFQWQGIVRDLRGVETGRQ